MPTLLLSCYGIFHTHVWFGHMLLVLSDLLGMGVEILTREVLVLCPSVLGKYGLIVMENACQVGKVQMKSNH